MFGIEELDIFGFPFEEEEVAFKALGFEEETNEGRSYLPTFVDLARYNLNVTIFSWGTSQLDEFGPLSRFLQTFQSRFHHVHDLFFTVDQGAQNLQRHLREGERGFTRVVVVEFKALNYPSNVFQDVHVEFVPFF